MNHNINPDNRDANNPLAPWNNDADVAESYEGKHPPIEELRDVVIAGIDTRDYPDFCDSYLESATWNGRELDRSEIESINENEGQWVYDQTIEHLY